MTVREKIIRLKTMVSEEVSEKLIVQSGGELLSSLRNDWRSCKDDFSNDDVSVLRDISEKIDAIKDFIEEQEDFAYISTKEEVDETVGRLYYIVEKADGLKVSGRVNKEIRELIEKKEKLPSKAISQRVSELKRAISSLSLNSPICKKCGSNMVLREGNGEYFWGCSLFPKCWGKKWLTNEERNALPD